MDNKNRKTKIDSIKNKYECRKLLKGMYPKLYFKAIKIDRIPNLVLPDANRKYFIKPQKGFFGIGVKKIDQNTDLVKLTKELKGEIDKGSKYFSL